MHLRTFQADDWAWVIEWFRDPVLNRELGPIDNEWLQAVLDEENGVELVAINDARPVALIGCIWGREPTEPHTVTDLAVAPSMRRQHVGSRALDMTMSWSGHPAGHDWRAFVDPRNGAAIRMLQGQGWEEQGTVRDMVEFRTRQWLMRGCADAVSP